MQMTTALLIVNPCDDEEDNMAMLCCHSDKGDMFLMSRYPDEDELEITLDGEPSTLDGVKVTLTSTLLKIEIAAADADALNGDDVLEISFNPDMVDMDEVVETLTNILDGTGTFINEIGWRPFWPHRWHASSHRYRRCACDLCNTSITVGAGLSAMRPELPPQYSLATKIQQIPRSFPALCAKCR
jgi:hypothetical protein